MIARAPSIKGNHMSINDVMIIAKQAGAGDWLNTESGQSFIEVFAVLLLEAADKEAKKAQ